MITEEQVLQAFEEWQPRIIIAGVLTDDKGPYIDYTICNSKEETETAIKKYTKPRFFYLKETEKPMFI